MLPDESWEDVSIHAFRKWVITDLFYMQIFKLYAGSDPCQTSAKSPVNGGKGEKGKVYCSFTPIVYSADGIPGMGAVAARQHLALLLINNLKREYSERYGFVRDRMSLAIVRSKTLLLHRTRDKEAYIRQRPNLEDGALMALLAPWQG